MGSDSKKLYGAAGRADLLYFDPEDLMVVTDTSHPLWDERVTMPVEERLVASIMKVGVLEPVIVRRNGARSDGTPVVEVIDGRQRVRAARVANHRLSEQGADPIRVPAVTRRGQDADMFGITITANEIRRADTPLVRAKKLQRYLDGGRSLEEAAVTFGASIGTLKNHLAILECHDDVLKALEAGRIGVMHAKKLSGFPREEQPAELAKLFEGRPEVEQGETIEEKIEKALGGRGKIRVRKIKSRKEIASFKERLQTSKAADAPLAIAMLEWFMGEEDALKGFRAIASRATGDDGED